MAGLFTSSPIDSFDYQSEVMVRLLGKAGKASKRAIPVYSEGEPGTETRELARASHQGGPRCEAPFIHVTALPMTQRIWATESLSSPAIAVAQPMCAENGTHTSKGRSAAPALQARLFDALAHIPSFRDDKAAGSTCTQQRSRATSARIFSTASLWCYSKSHLFASERAISAASLKQYWLA